MLTTNKFLPWYETTAPKLAPCHGSLLFIIILFSQLCSTACAQVISVTPAGVTADCQTTYNRALELTQEYEKKLTPEDRSMAESIVDKMIKRGASRADGYNEYGGGEMMKARYMAATWGSLKAAILEWNPRHINNVGIYLSYLNKLDDAGLFIQCAEKLAPQSSFVIEAQAMLAYRKLDYKTATRSIEQAVRMMPGDMNVRYTAGVIFYKAGDRQRAKQFLKDADRIAPNNKTIIEALKVVDPSGQSNPPPQDALRKLVDECFRFMDDLLVRGERAGSYIEEMKGIEGASQPGGPVSGEAYETMRLAVLQSKAEIANLETRTREKQNSARSVDWNATLQSCIIACLTTTANYQQIINDRGVDLIIAKALRITPIRLSEKMKKHESSNYYRYVIQDEKYKYFLVEDPARKSYQANAKSCEGRADDEACRRPYLEKYCGTVIPVWKSHWENVLANMRTVEANFPDAAKDYATRWKRLSNHAAEFSKRALAAMKPVTDADLKFIPAASRTTIISISSPAAHAKQAKEAYKSYVGSMTSLLVASTLSQSNEFVMDALDTAPDAFLQSAFYIENCEQKKPGTLSLDAEMEKLLAALIEASEFNATGEIECEIEIGNWKTSFKPFSSDNNLNIETSNVKVSVDAENNRWGAEYTVADGIDVNAGPFTGEVSVKVWGEGEIGSGKMANYGIEAEGKVGIGKETAIGGAACYFGTTSFKFNARAFASALSR